MFSEREWIIFSNSVFFSYSPRSYFSVLYCTELCEKRANSSGSRSIWNYDAVATAICIFQQIVDYNHPSSMCKILTLKSSNEGAIASISKITAGFGIQHDLCKYIPLLYSTTLKRDCLNGCTFWQVAAVLVIFQVQLNTIVLKKKHCLAITAIRAIIIAKAPPRIIDLILERVRPDMTK